MRPVTPLKIAIVASGFTTKEVAERIHRHPDEVGRYANGRRVPTWQTKQLLAWALDMPVEQLFPEPDGDANGEPVAA
jgi:transcriptional regulator with XRE-family HTH domain